MPTKFKARRAPATLWQDSVANKGQRPERRPLSLSALLVARSPLHRRHRCRREQMAQIDGRGDQRESGEGIRRKRSHRSIGRPASELNPLLSARSDYLQGTSKRLFPGCENMWWKNCVSCLQKVNKTQLCHLISHNLWSIF